MLIGQMLRTTYMHVLPKDAVLFTVDIGQKPDRHPTDSHD